MARWVSSTETEQAQWIVRSFLVFSALDLDRAYVYFYNDNDKPSFHASSGITRNFVPKPAYWAMAHLYKTLSNFRFSRVIEKTGDLYIYEFVNPDRSQEPIWAIWSPTGDQRESEKTITVPGEALEAGRMPVAEGDAEKVPVQQKGGIVQLPVGESPVYLRLKLR